MKNLSLLFIVILLIQSTLLAQTSNILWSRSFGGQWGACVIETFDNNYVVVASIAEDVRLLKVNGLGDLVWEKTYGKPNLNDEGLFVQQTPDSGLIIVGSTESLGSGLEDTWLLKTNEFGDTLWTKTFGGYNSERSKCVRNTIDGGFIIAAYTNSYGLGLEDYFLIKTDSLGNEQWTSVFGCPGEEYCDFVIETSDSCYLIGGGSNSFCTTGWDTWLIKTDSNGDSIWAETYYNPWDNYHTCAIEINDGYVMGHGDSYLGGYMSRIAPLGNLIWTKLFLWPLDYERINVNGICKTNADRILIGGRRYTDYYSQGYMATTDFNGVVEWYTELGVEDIISLIETSDSCYVATGTTYNGELLVIKLSPPVSGLNQSDKITIQAFSLFPNYPNPFNPVTTIKYQIPKRSEITIKVFSLLGQEVRTLVNDEKSAGIYEAEFNAKDLPSGVYFYQLRAGDFIQTKKMLLLK